MYHWQASITDFTSDSHLQTSWTHVDLYISSNLQFHSSQYGTAWVMTGTPFCPFSFNLLSNHWWNFKIVHMKVHLSVLTRPLSASPVCQSLQVWPFSRRRRSFDSSLPHKLMTSRCSATHNEHPESGRCHLHGFDFRQSACPLVLLLSGYTSKSEDVILLE